MNSRTNDATGSTPAAAAFGANNDPNPNNPPLVVVVAAAGTDTPEPPNSRRVNANAVHANGPAAGTPPPLPPLSHDNNAAPNPDTELPTAAAGAAAADITGTAPAGRTAAAEPDPDPVRPAADSAVDEPIAADGNTAAGNTGDACPCDIPRSLGDGTAPGGTGTGIADDPAAESAGILTGDSSTAAPRRRGAPTGASITTDGPPLRARLARGAGAGAVCGAGAETSPVCGASGNSGTTVAVTTGAAGSTTAAPPARVPPRVATRVDPESVDPESDDSVDPPVDPPEPRVSAKATGIDTNAAPTPNVTARAPTRPM
jgi:hypothetical protein